MTERLRILGQGAAFTICAPVNERGRCSVEKELERYERRNSIGYERIMALLARIAVEGMEGLQETVLRHLGGGLLEFKEPRGLMRLTGFYDTNRKRFIILNSAFKKGGKKNQQEKIESARQAMEAYHRTGGLPLEEE